MTSPRKRLQLWIRPQVAEDDLDRRRRRGVGASRKGDVLNNFVKFWQVSCCQRRNLLPLFYPQELTGVGFVLFLVSSSFFIFVRIQAPETISVQSSSDNFSSVVAMTVTPSVRNICNICGTELVWNWRFRDTCLVCLLYWRWSSWFYQCWWWWCWCWWTLWLWLLILVLVLVLVLPYLLQQ